jgi:NAD(P)-dependent dehydrogenase (short-subunit alcohol dehydrogenase family)
LRDLAGKTAVITGGGSGIGLGIAQALLEAGMSVAIADLLEAHLVEAQQLLVAHRERLMCVQLDVRDRAAFAECRDAVCRRFGTVNVLCNNAGVGSDTPMAEAPLAEWDWVFGVNVGGTINGISTFLPVLKQSGQAAHIVNTGSVAALIPLMDAGIYSSSKFAIRGISETLRLSLAPLKIGVSLLCPGLTRSRIFDSVLYRPDSVPTLPTRTGLSEELKSVLASAAMDPLEVGRAVVAGIRNNDGYIFTHPEFKDEVEELFSEILSAFPSGGTISEARAALERQSRATRSAARAAAGKRDL